tara:strand:+ start:226 stop:357 length:132 start_codon:yes stop_codon:yes gene_type:complete
MAIADVSESGIPFNIPVEFTKGGSVQTIYLYGSVPAIKGFCPE